MLLLLCHVEDSPAASNLVEGELSQMFDKAFSLLHEENRRCISCAGVLVLLCVLYGITYDAIL